MSDFSREPLLLEERIDSVAEHRGVLKRILESREYAISAMLLNLGVVGVGSYVAVSSFSHGEVGPAFLALTATAASTSVLADIGIHADALLRSAPPEEE